MLSEPMGAQLALAQLLDTDELNFNLVKTEETDVFTNIYASVLKKLNLAFPISDLIRHKQVSIKQKLFFKNMFLVQVNKKIKETVIQNR